jgi:hypothetical protein
VSGERREAGSGPADRGNARASDVRPRPADRSDPETGAVGTPDEVEIPAPKANPGARAVDDHVAGRPYGLGHQPSDDLDAGVGDEHVDSPSQGVRPDPS